MPNTKLDTSYKPAAIDQARLFAQGGEYPELTDRDEVGFLGITQIGGISIARGDGNTYSIQSTSTGQVQERTASRGSFEPQTGTFTQYLDETLDEPWYKALKRDAPMRFIIPLGENRSLQEIDSFTSMIIIDNVFVNTNTIDDNINQPDAGTVGTPMNLSGDFGYHPLNVHWGYGLTFQNETISALDRPVVGAVTRVSQKEGINYFLATAGNAAVTADTTSTPSQPAVEAAGAMVIGRNGYDEWQSTAIPMTTATDIVTDLALAGDKLLLPYYTGTAGEEGHYVIDVDDVLKGVTSVVDITAGHVSGKGVNKVFAYSSGEIIWVGQGGYIFRSTSPTSALRTVNAGVATTQNLNDINAYGDVMVAVGGSGAVIVSTDRGNTWVAATAAGTAGLNCVSVHSDNMLFAGDDTGDLWRSRDQGVSWTEVTHGITLNEIVDIEFLEGFEVTSGIGYLVGNVTTAESHAAVVARTVDGGINWHSGGNHLNVQPSVDDAAGLVLREANSVLVFGGEEVANDGLVALIERE
jgi:hypothetical protein